MNFDQLSAFIAAVEAPTFMDAAEIAHTTQSNISKQIQSLEKELSVPLFSRAGRKAEVTPQGLLFYQDVKQLVDLYKSALFRLQMFQGEHERTIRIGTLPFQAQYHIPPLFQKFREAYPDVKLIIEEAEEATIMKNLQQDQYDFVIIRETMLDFQSMVSYPICEDRFMAIVPQNHLFSGQKSLSLSELCDDSFFLMNPNTSIYELSASLLRKHHLESNLIGTGRPETILEQIPVTGAIGLLPEQTCKLFHPKNVVLLPLDPAINLPIVLAQKKTTVTTAAMKDLIRFLLRHNEDDE